jgi:hypothetical protein
MCVAPAQPMGGPRGGGTVAEALLPARHSVKHCASQNNQITSGAISNLKMSNRAICQIHMIWNYHQRIEAPPVNRQLRFRVHVSITPHHS